MSAATMHGGRERRRTCRGEVKSRTDEEIPEMTSTPPSVIVSGRKRAAFKSQKEDEPTTHSTPTRTGIE